MSRGGPSVLALGAYFCTNVPKWGAIGTGIP